MNHKTKEKTLNVGIKMGNDSIHNILISDQCDIHSVCKDFCFKNNLDKQYESFLIKEIQKYLSFNTFSSCLEEMPLVKSSKMMKKCEYLEEALKNCPSNDIKKKNFSFNPIVNEKSNKMINNKRKNDKTCVYQRLFDQKKDVPDFFYEKENYEYKILNEGCNYGEILYEKGLENQILKKEKINKIKKQNEDLEIKNCTYKPSINELSRLMAKNKRSCSIQAFSKEKIEKIEQILKEREISEMKECTFVPKIDDMSKQIDTQKKDKTKSFDRFEQLYQNFKQKKNSIHRKKWSDHNKIDNLSSSNFEKFLNRQEDFTHKKQQKILIKEEENNKKFYFTPKIGRSPKSRSNFSHHSCNKTDDLSDKKNNQPSISEQRSKSNRKKILKTKQLSNFRIIFNLMDENNFGFLSSDNLNTNGLSENILNLYLPMIGEIQEFHENINFDEFVLISENMLEKLNVEEKRNFEISESHRKNFQRRLDYDFKPEINKKSLSLAKKKRNEKKFASLYDYFKEEKENQEKKIEQEKQLLEERKLEECTFHPTISSYEMLCQKIKKQEYFIP